jgi:hypothetical protein
MINRKTHNERKGFAKIMRTLFAKPLRTLALFAVDISDLLAGKLAHSEEFFCIQQ